MKTFNEFVEEKTPAKAGIVPYYFDENNVFVYLMIPSDPAYGGSSPQIAKGRVDPGESAQQTAIREGEEELGLKPTNIKSITLGWSGNTQGMLDSHAMVVYIAEVVNPRNFGKPHYETGWAGWLPAQEALNKCRTSQKHILQQIINKIMPA